MCWSTGSDYLLKVDKIVDSLISSVAVEIQRATSVSQRLKEYWPSIDEGNCTKRKRDVEAQKDNGCIYVGDQDHEGHEGEYFGTRKGDTCDGRSARQNNANNRTTRTPSHCYHNKTMKTSPAHSHAVMVLRHSAPSAYQKRWPEPVNHRSSSSSSSTLRYM